MPFYERNDIKGWYYFIVGGLIFGFLIGLIIANKVEPQHSKYYLYSCIAAGLLLGLILARWVDKKRDMNEWFIPTYRSPDLGNFQDRFIDMAKDNNVIEYLAQFTDYQLVLLIIYRYTDLLKETKTMVGNELIKRSIDKNRFQELFEQIKTFDFRKYGICPKCGYEKYVTETTPDEINCILCGYNDNIDNPKLFLNKLNKIFGYYDDKKLNWDKVVKAFYT